MATVIIQNKLSQQLAVTLLDEHDSLYELKLAPRGHSEAVDDAKITSYTRQLAQEKGFIRIRPAS